MFAELMQKRIFFDTLQKTLTSTMQNIQDTSKDFVAELEKCSVEYLIATEHIQAPLELLTVEHILSFDKSINFLDKNAELSQLYECFRDHDYQYLNQLVKKIANNNYKSDKKNQITILAKKAVLLIEQYTSDCRVSDCLDELDKLINEDQLIIERDTIKDQHTKKAEKVEYYQGCITLLTLIKEYSQKAQQSDITIQSQQELLENLEQTFESLPNMLAKLLEPIINKINSQLINECVESKQSISDLINSANQIIFANTFGVESLRIVSSNNLLNMSQEQLAFLKQYIENIDGSNKYTKIQKSLDASLDYLQYQDLSTNLIEISNVFNIKEVLYSLAEFKINALTCGTKYNLWRPIIEQFEDRLFVGSKALKIFSHKQTQTIIVNEKNALSMYFKLRLNIQAWHTFYQLAFERFLVDVPKIDIGLLRRHAWLSQQDLQKIPKSDDKKGVILQKYKQINDSEEQALYDIFIDALSKLNKFKNTKFKDFSNTNVDDYLISFDVEDAQDFLKKKLAYKALYSRNVESSHTKIYQELYSKWMEIQSLYGEGFIVCDLDYEIAVIDELFVQIRDNFLTQEMLKLCDKAFSKISELYRECCERKMFEKLTQRVRGNTSKLDSLKGLLQKHKLSINDIKVIKDLESIVEKSTLKKDSGISSKYIEELSKNCQKQNPLFDAGAKLEKVNNYLDSLQNSKDRKSSVSEITKQISSL